MKVPLLDLTRQFHQLENEIRPALEEVLRSQQFILGPKVAALEEAVASYCGCGHAAGISSGTDALLVSLMALGIGAGHGVVTTPFTFFATAGVIARTGARPFFVDIDPRTYNMDPSALAEFLASQCRWEKQRQELIHRQTGVAVRAVMPVHLYGQCADMEPILELARRYQLFVIEDAAQAIGAAYPAAGAALKAGTMGDLGCFSFFPTKNLGGCGDGGMVISNDGGLIDKIKVLRVHGSQPKYVHLLVGGNFRLDALQAAVLQVKLQYLDRWTEMRRLNAATYTELFLQSGLVGRELVLPPAAIWERAPGEATVDPPGRAYYHTYNQYVIRARSRDRLRRFLTAEGIGTEIYYPIALHQQECFAYLGYRPGDFPASEKATSEVLALPIFPELQPAEIDYVVDRIAKFYA